MPPSSISSTALTTCASENSARAWPAVRWHVLPICAEALVAAVSLRPQRRQVVISAPVFRCVDVSVSRHYILRNTNATTYAEPSWGCYGLPMKTTAEPNTTTPNYRDTVTQTPTNAWPRFADLWDILLTPGGFTPRPDSPAVAAMLADSYDEHDH